MGIWMAVIYKALLTIVGEGIISLTIISHCVCGERLIILLSFETLNRFKMTAFVDLLQRARLPAKRILGRSV